MIELFPGYAIKTPQFIGIVAGCCVFIVTISVVLYLLYRSGSWFRFVEEVNSGKPLQLKNQVTTTLNSFPTLYDHLLDARKSKLNLGDCLIQGKNIDIKITENKDLEELFTAGNGSPIFHECSYDPARLWMWSEFSTVCNENGEDKLNYPVYNLELFQEYCNCKKEKTVDTTFRFSIIDHEFKRPIGMISVVDVDQHHLTVRLDDLWVTPAYQGKRIAHEALYYILKHLFTVLNFRRIVYEVDTRHSIGKKFLERCGFFMESVSRKNRIVQNRNRDSCVYVLLNSEWEAVDEKLRTFLSIEKDGMKMHKIAELPTTEEIVDEINFQAKKMKEKRK